MAREFDAKKLTLGPPRRVVSQLGSTTGPAAVSRGGILMYWGGLDTRRFMWLDRAGKTLEVLGEPDGYWYFRLSPDGKHFVTSRGYGRPPTDLWLMTVERHVFSLFAPPARATSVYRSPVWSNDGRTVLFSKGGTVFRKDVTASGEGDRVAEWPGLNRLCDWSRDGRLLLYESLPDPETKRDLWVAEVTPDGRPVEGTQPKPYVRGPFAEWQGRFSPEPNPRWAA